MPNAADEPADGPIGRLLASIGEFFATLLTVGRTRLELLSVELQLELRRAAAIALWAAVAIISAAFALMMAGITVIIVFWDTHRLLAAAGVTGFYVVLSASAIVMVVAHVKSRPRMLDATLTELARDSEQLRRRNG